MAWIGVLTVMMVPSLLTMGRDAVFVLIAVPAFPLGLLWFIDPSWCNYDSNVGFELVWCIWPVYLAMAVALFAIKQRIKYFLIYGIMCLLLILNVLGCHLLMHDPKVQLFHLGC